MDRRPQQAKRWRSGTVYSVLSTQYSFPTFALLLALVLSGCDYDEANIGQIEAVWGRAGITDGRFQTPRAIAIDGDENLYIVDKTARIQVFKRDGTFLRQWSTPDHTNGKPTGMSVDRDGNLLVADTHYFQILVYSPEGNLLRKLGGVKGEKLGQFGLVTGTAQDSQGNLYVSEYGECDRIQKFAPDGRPLLQWGSHGSEPGQFVRPQKMVFDEEDHLWVTDAGNHRIQVFDTQGKLLKLWGTQGSKPGELYYPYDIALAPHDTLYLCEYGNHRIQRFTRDGRSLGCWGHEGRGHGELFNPWGLVRDHGGRIHVLDTNNNRIYCVRVE
jgi:sugar lactone lactonase YvrE